MSRLELQQVIRRFGGDFLVSVALNVRYGEEEANQFINQKTEEELFLFGFVA
jgi:predicted SpoU family rRNA methylase